MDNWLEITIGVFLLGMVLYGHWRGFIRLAVSMLTLVITFAAVRLALPYAADYVRQNTSVHEWLAKRVESLVQPEEFPVPGDGVQISPQDESTRQRQFIEEMELPDEIKELLIENNNSDIYELLGVNAFTEYIGNYLAGIVLNLVGSVLLFLLIYISLRLLSNALDLVARLPILSGMNQLAGALLGGMHGLLFVWFFFLILSIFSKAGWSMRLMEQIRSSGWLSLLYRYNLITRLILGIFRGMLA